MVTVTVFKYTKRYKKLRKHLKTHIMGYHLKKVLLPALNVHFEKFHSKRTPVKTDSV